jgi:hypothetical protein
MKPWSLLQAHSKNAHYHWYNIQKRHWFAHGKYLGLGTEAIQSIIEHLLDKTEQALDNTFNGISITESVEI